MSDHATVSAPPAASRSAARVGSFEIGPRVVDGQQRLGNTALVAVTGAADTQYAGLSGYAYCAALPDNNPALLEQATAHMGRIGGVQGPNLVPIIESGVSGRVAFVAESAIQGERLSTRLGKERRLPAWLAARTVADVATGLEVAHTARISHGAIVPTVIWIDGGNRSYLGGFGLAGRGPVRDQEMLGQLAFEMITGIQWNPEIGQNATGAALVERLRGQTNGLSERVAVAIARTLETDQALKFQSVSQFAAALREAAIASAADATAGAWEAVGRGDLAMANLFFDNIVAYDPTCSEIPLIRHRMTALENGAASAPGMPGMPGMGGLAGFAASQLSPFANPYAPPASPHGFGAPAAGQFGAHPAAMPDPGFGAAMAPQNPHQAPPALGADPGFAPAPPAFASGSPHDMQAQGFVAQPPMMAGYGVQAPMSVAAQPGVMPGYGQHPMGVAAQPMSGSPYGMPGYGQVMAPPATPEAFAASMLTADNMNPELRALLAPELPPLQKPKNNPWIVFVLGVLALVIVMTILVALTFFST